MHYVTVTEPSGMVVEHRAGFGGADRPNELHHEAPAADGRPAHACSHNPTGSVVAHSLPRPNLWPQEQKAGPDRSAAPTCGGVPPARPFAAPPQVTKVPISHIMSSNPLHIALLTNGFRLHHHTRCPDLTDSAPFQRPPMLEGQYLGSDLEISVVVQQCHIMGVGKGGDQ